MTRKRKVKLEVKNIDYNVHCNACGGIFQPTFKTPLWWKAHKKSQGGYLDAYNCNGHECGCCGDKPEKATTPYRVLGYGMMGEHFDIACDTFVRAMKVAKRRRFDMPIVVGVSARVSHYIDLNF